MRCWMPCPRFKDAQQKANERAAEEMQKMTEGLGLPPGMNLPF